MSVRGNIIDENDKEVIGCSVRILSTDSTFLSGGVTNDVGNFILKVFNRITYRSSVIYRL